MGTISSRFLQKNIDSCIALGIDKNSLLNLVPNGVLALNNPLHRFDGEVLISILSHAESLSNDPAIGFRCGLNHGHAVYSDMAYTIQYCENLGQSFEVSARYERLIQQFGENQLFINGDTAGIVWETYVDAPDKLRHISDLSFATLARMGLWIKAVHGLTVKSMQVKHTNNSYHDLYASMFECPITYGADVDKLTFDKRFLDVPLPSANPALLNLLTARLERDLNTFEAPKTMEQNVQAFLEKTLGIDPPTLSHVSGLMDISERSLRRKLKACGSNFRQILERVREERYHLLIQQPELTQVQIAGMLGYSEQSALSRARRKWREADKL